MSHRYKNWAIGLTLVNLILFAVAVNWNIFAKQEQLRDGQRVLLEVTRYDPRSLLQGDYMALTYPICDQIERRIAKDARGEGQVVIRIDENDVGHFLRIHHGSELGPDEHLLSYRIRWGQRSRVRVAAVEYLFQEGRAEEFGLARYAELRVGADGGTLLVALCDLNRQRI